MPQKIKSVGQFRLGDWVTLPSWKNMRSTPHEIITFSASRTHAHVKNKLGAMEWVLIAVLKKSKTNSDYA